MKKLFLLALLFAATAAMSQEAVKFKDINHAFGKIKQNVPASYVFTFTNTSGKPLVIETATAGCGCTTPEYPKTPIMKDKKGDIKVTYNAANPGPFTKEVTVKFANVAAPIVLTITGEVVTEAKPAAPQP
jgi:hypothetical protein